MKPDPERNATSSPSVSVSILLLLFHIFLRHHHGTAVTWLESLKNGQDDATPAVASSLFGGCLFSPLSIHLIPYFQGALVLSSLRGPSNEAMTKEEEASARARWQGQPAANQKMCFYSTVPSVGAFEKATFFDSFRPSMTVTASFVRSLIKPGPRELIAQMFTTTGTRSFAGLCLLSGRAKMSRTLY